MGGSRRRDRRVVASELTRRVGRQSWRKIPDGLTNYNWTEGQLGCRVRLKKIRSRREENAPPFARNKSAKGRPPRIFGAPKVRRPSGTCPVSALIRHGPVRACTSLDAAERRLLSVDAVP